jgi:hypothetical protein
MEISNQVQRAIDNPPGTDASVTRRKFVVEIDLTNSAFGEGENPEPWEASMEVARILREVADLMYGGTHPRTHRLFDVNGGFVGTAEFKVSQE